MEAAAAFHIFSKLFKKLTCFMTWPIAWQPTVNILMMCRHNTSSCPIYCKQISTWETYLGRKIQVVVAGIQTAFNRTE
jgi:hypothetical protein